MTPALEARAMARRFAAVEALRGLSFSVTPGELYGLIGPDGAGKTTAIRALAGLLALDGGEALVLGQDPARAREALGLLPQHYCLYGDLSVAENLRFFGRLHLLSRETYASRSRRLLAITGLAPFLERRADALSGGMYKKLALACALLHEPQVLLLDEPTNGVDPLSRRELWMLLNEFVRAGMAVLISTPYMDEAERCTRVGLVHRGRMLLEGEPRALLSQLPCETYEVTGARDRAEAALESVPEVWSTAPSGSRLRILVAPRASPRVAEALSPLGATLHAATPRFGDLFLARLHEEAA